MVDEPTEAEADNNDDEGFIVPDFDWLTEEWVLAGVALRDATDLYDSVYQDRGKAETEAIAALLHRLQEGVLWARAPKWHASLGYSGLEPDLADLLPGYSVTQDDADLIASDFWHNLAQARQSQLKPPESGWMWAHARLDWVAGDFEFYHEIKVEKGPMKVTHLHGSAYGICFNRSGLPTTQRIHAGGWHNGASPIVSANVRPRGRPAGSGGFAVFDAPLVAKMREMVLATPGLTAFGAAAHFAGAAEGTGGFEAKQRRLANLYRKTHPD